MRRLFKLAPLIVAVIASPAMAQESLQRLINAQPAESAAIASISLVRKSILLEAAQRLGIQAGLADRSKIILAEVSRRADALDARYRFQQLIIDAALLPPVIVETKDAVSL